MHAIARSCATLCRALTTIGVTTACHEQTDIDKVSPIDTMVAERAATTTNETDAIGAGTIAFPTLPGASEAAPIERDAGVGSNEQREGGAATSEESAVAHDVASARLEEPVVDYDKDGPVCRPAEVMFSGGFGCIISDSRHLHCWGSNGSFATGTRGGEECGDEAKSVCVRNPVLVPGIDSVAKVAAGGGGGTCAVRTDGSVWCWGSNMAGLLGFGIEEVCDGPGAPMRDGQPQPCTPDPVRIQGIQNAVDIDAWGGMCALSASGTVYTWSWYGRTSPTPVLGVSGAVEVEDGCALLEDGSVVCWPPDTLSSERIDWQGTATELSLGYQMGCVVDDEGHLSCWNLDAEWESTALPEGALDCLSGASCAYRAEPIDISYRVVAVSGSYEVMWLLTDEGEVRAFVLGQLSSALALPAPAIQISAGWNGACALLEDRTVYCWTNPGIVDKFLDLGEEPKKIELCLTASD